MNSNLYRYFIEGDRVIAPNLYFLVKNQIEKLFKNRNYLKRNKILSGRFLNTLIPKSFYEKFSRTSPFGDNTIIKFAGLFDPPKNYLNPHIFNSSNKIYPHVRQQIIETVYNFIEPQYVKEIIFLGTSAGYQWNEDSDIDINVSVFPHELLTEELNMMRHAYNNKNHYLSGTKQKINLFLKPYVENSPWQDVKFGAYDILNDCWLAFPEKNLRNPEEEYYLPLIFARMIHRNYLRYVARYRKAVNEYNILLQVLQNDNSKLAELKLIKKLNEVKKREEELINFVKSIDSTRKLEYSLGWGVPRQNYRNVLFKFFELKDKNNLFQKLKEYRLKNIDRFKLQTF